MGSVETAGGCRCGEVRYRIVGVPGQSIVCHCPDCRRSTGAHAVAWLIVDSTQFAFTQGLPRAHASSPGVLRHFCGTCGTSLCWFSDRHPARVDVTVGSLDDPARYPPTRAVYRQHRLPWASEV